MPTSPDTPEGNIRLMQDAIAAMNRRDLDTCVGLLTPDFAINLAGVPGQMRGTDAWRGNAQVMLAAFSDIQIHVEDIFATEDKVALRIRLTGTHDGAFLGTPPSGRQVDYQSNELYRIADGKIAEEWICSDMLTLMTQIGAIPARQDPPSGQGSSRSGRIT